MAGAARRFTVDPQRSERLEYFDGIRWLPVIGAQLAPAYGSIQGGQSHPGETHLVAEYTMPYACDARITHSVLLNGDAAWAGKLSVRFDTGAVIFDVCVAAWAAIPITGHVVDVPAGGLGAGQKVQVVFVHNASPGGNVAFYTDPSNNRGSALIGARFGSPTTATVQPADTGRRPSGAECEHVRRHRPRKTCRTTATRTT